MYFGGDVYSSVDPFATALGDADGKVSFIGSDEAAHALDAAAIDLDGDFLTPGFVHAGLVLTHDSPSPADLIDRGFSHVHVLGRRAQIAAFIAEAGDGLSIVDYPNDPAADDPRRSLTASAFLSLDELPDASVFIIVSSHDELSKVLTSIAADAAHAQRHGYRLLLQTPVTEVDVDALSTSGVALTIDPALDEPDRQPLAQLLAAGAQVSWTFSGSSPWEAVRAAVVHEHGLSARAAFNAATRFAHRAGGNPEGGVLRPGAVADQVRWRVDRLVIQVADPRVAAWSTDPASGTPGLPELAPEVALPVRVPLR